MADDLVFVPNATHGMQAVAGWLARRLAPDRPTYGLQAPDGRDDGDPERLVPAMAARARLMRSRNGPVGAAALMSVIVPQSTPPTPSVSSRPPQPPRNSRTLRLPPHP